MSESNQVTILLGFQIQRDRHHELNTPDTAITEQGSIWIIGITILRDARVEDKELEKLEKGIYCTLQ